MIMQCVLNRLLSEAAHEIANEEGYVPPSDQDWRQFISLHMGQIADRVDRKIRQQGGEQQ